MHEDGARRGDTLHPAGSICNTHGTPAEKHNRQVSPVVLIFFPFFLILIHNVKQVAGRHQQVTWLRKDGTFPKLTRDHIMESVHGSLERMGTDYIDVLSFGDWPER